MRKIVSLSFALLWIYLPVFGQTVDYQGSEKLIEPLRGYVEQVIDQMEGIPEDRKEILERIGLDISRRLQSEEAKAWLIYICTHNSRRSHMAQLWARTAACYYGLDQVNTFSGGTEATACNIRTVSALRRAGFSVVTAEDGENPVFLIQFSDEYAPMRAYSKIYNQGNNPKDDFIALMCCSQADMSCPIVDGASSRYAIHYVDPKERDDSDEEVEAYDSRCREIAREMFYLMSQVSHRMMVTKSLPEQ
jgi:protein-tyrosine-phosphatase